MGLLDSLNAGFYTPQEDAFGIGAGVIGAAAPHLTSPYQSSGKNIGTAVGAALLAGLLGGLAKKRTETANQGLLNQALGAMRIGGEGKYDALAENPRLAQFAGALRASDYENQIERANKAEDVKNELDKALQVEKTKALLSDPEAARRAYPNIDKDLGIITGVATNNGAVKERTILEKVEALPKDQKEIAYKELDTINARETIAADVNEAFDEARKLKLRAAGSAIPYTESSGYINKINTTIAEAIQGASGKEKSDKNIQNLIDGLLITPLDLERPELLAAKEVAVQKAMDRYLKRTPILEMTGIVPRKTYKSNAGVSSLGNDGGVSKPQMPQSGQIVTAPNGKRILIR